MKRLAIRVVSVALAVLVSGALGAMRRAPRT